MIHASWSQNKTFKTSTQPYLLRVVEDEFTLASPNTGDHVLVTKADGSVSEDVLGRFVAEIRSKSASTRGKLLWYFEQASTPEAAEVRRRSLRDGELRPANPASSQPGDGSRFSEAAEAPPENPPEQKSQDNADRFRASLSAHIEAKERIQARRKRDERQLHDTDDIPF